MTTESPDILPDVLEPNLIVVFCGTAPGNVSARLEAYYALPANKFWPTLYQTGITPIQLPPRDYPKVVEYGIGLTDVAKKHFGVDAAIPADAYDAEGLRQKIEHYKPRILAFDSKEAARQFFRLKSTKLLQYGRQNETVGETEIWVLPSTSGLAISYWNIQPWQDLAARVNELRNF